MIGRDGQVDHFDLVRWARRQAVAHELRTLEAHVLLLLSTYANRDGIAWPSIKTLALDCGLTPTRDGRNSAVSAALARLEDRGLVWTKQAGHGHPAKRELLFDPAAEPSGVADGCDPGASEPSGLADGQPSALTDAQPSGLADQKNQRKSHPEEPEGRDQRSLPATRKASHPEIRTARNGSRDESPERVRAAVRDSLAQARAAATRTTA